MARHTPSLPASSAPPGGSSASSSPPSTLPTSLLSSQSPLEMQVGVGDDHFYRLLLSLVKTF